MGFSSTVKEHAVTASGNECACPGCTEVIFDPEAKTLVGEVAHIKGNKPGFLCRHDSGLPEVHEVVATASVSGVVVGEVLVLVEVPLEAHRPRWVNTAVPESVTGALVAAPH